MARGFLGGFLVGAVLSAGAAVVLVGLAGPPRAPEVGTDVPAAGVAPSDSPDPSAPVTRRGEDDPAHPSTPVVGAPPLDAGLSLTDEDTRPADRPQTGEATGDVVAPGAQNGAGGVAMDDEAPVSLGRQTAAPVPPDADPQAAIPTVPPRAPLSGDGAGGGAGLQAPGLEGFDGPVTPGAETTITDRTGSPAIPGAPDQTVDPAVFADSAPRPQADADAAADAPDATDAADAPTAPAGTGSEETGTAPGPAAPPDPPDTDSLPRTSRQPAAPDAGESRPDTATLPQTEGAEVAPDTRRGPPIGTPATSLLDRDPDASGAAQAGDDADPARQAAAAATGDADQPALQHNAEPFEVPDGLPLMSIILTDTGQNLEDGPVGLAALGSFPHPLSFAVDTSLPDAAERAARYRTRGMEVLALVDLPRNLTASDTEVALTTLLARVPQAVAVLEGSGTGLQGSTEMSEQVRAILQETGHGIIWQPRGLDTAQQRAARAGVASETLFRTFGDDGQSPMVIRRGLDQSALRAGQQGSVILVGRARPDTITALILWGLQDRAQRVAVAPVSAVLTQRQEDG